MSDREIKKRRTQQPETIAMEPPAGLSTVTRDEVAKWQQDNQYILSGYRKENADYLEILASLTFLHNETWNVYTHLVGAIAVLPVATTTTLALSQPQFASVSATDYVMFSIFFFCAESCLLCSAVYHLVGPHSRHVEQFWHRMDLLGIVVATVGTVIPGIYYIFFCRPDLQRFHWTIVSRSNSQYSCRRGGRICRGKTLTKEVHLGHTVRLSTALLICNPGFRTLRWRKRRVGSYVALGATSFVPMLHGVQLYGLGHMLNHSGIKWYLIELAFYGIGACFYAV